MEQLLDYDAALFLYLNNLGSTTWDWFWLFMTNKYYQIPIYVVFLVLLLKTKHWKEVVLVMVTVALLITVTDQTATYFKRELFMRWRPCLQEGVMEYTRQILGRCIGYGYFSGHAANSMAVAVFLRFVLRKHYRRIVPLFIVWALIVGYSRIYVGVHYPLDVMTGFAFGTMYASLFYLLYRYVLKRFLKTTF